MDDRITAAEIARDPSLITTRVDRGSRRPIALRPLVAGDARILGQYFVGLSPETRRRYAPHPFDRETAGRLCAEIDYA